MSALFKYADDSNILVPVFRLAPFFRASCLFFASRAFSSRLAPFLRALRLFSAPRAFFSSLAPFFRASRLFFTPRAFSSRLAPFFRAFLSCLFPRLASFSLKVHYIILKNYPLSSFNVYGERNLLNK